MPWRRDIIQLIVLGLLWWTQIDLPDPLFSNDYSTVIRDRNGAMLRAFLNSEEQLIFPPRADVKIPEKLLQAVIKYEDKRFYSHPGIDFLALSRATFQYLRDTRVVSGASTISMQVCRMMGQRPRHLGSKIIEMQQALKLELNYSKEEILRAYLNHAPYGGNIRGYRAASWRYFGKEAQSLTWAEAAMLAVLPNAPGLASPMRGQERLRRKRDALLHRLHAMGHLDSTDLKLASSEKIPQTLQQLPCHAPHATRLLEKLTGFKGREKRVSIDLNLQRRVQATCRQHNRQLSGRGINALAAIIINNQNSAINAYVGSPDIRNKVAEGAVDGVLASRSSGSILKPFLFALSIDAGLITPLTLIHDVPTYYGSFAPTNYDHEFRGVVRARQALIRSLNVPAVRLLNSFGLHSFYAFLQDAGVSTLFRTPQAYGLSLILGGAEVSLLEMAGLYSGLATGQFNRQPHFFVASQDLPKPSQRWLLSDRARWQVLQILSDVSRPGAEAYWQNYSGAIPIAWKTGTSYSFRDAWAIGVTAQWTVAVWCGNFDGTENPEIIGTTAAGPLLFALFSQLPLEQRTAVFPEPESDQREVFICRESGLTAGLNCQHRLAYKVPLLAPALPVCSYHQSRYVDKYTGFAVCSYCWDRETTDRHSYMVFTPLTDYYMRRNNIAVATVPGHNPECPMQADADILTIVYPRAGSRLWVPRDIDSSWQKIQFRAAHKQRHSTLHWFLNHELVGTTQDKHKLALNIASGTHRLAIVDERGRRAEISFSAFRRMNTERD
jgi:penicillin-binding protein 1C